MEFFLPMVPPTVTHQDKQLRAFLKNGRPRAVLHDSERLRDTRAKLHAALAPHRPAAPMQGPVRLVVKWLFPCSGEHCHGEWKTTRPDTDNLQKALKDEMTRLGFWRDDALVASETCEKFWTKEPCGVYICAYEMDAVSRFVGV